MIVFWQWGPEPKSKEFRTKMNRSLCTSLSFHTYNIVANTYKHSRCKKFLVPDGNFDPHAELFVEVEFSRTEAHSMRCGTYVHPCLRPWTQTLDLDPGPSIPCHGSEGDCGYVHLTQSIQYVWRWWLMSSVSQSPATRTDSFHPFNHNLRSIWTYSSKNRKW